jgi:cytochrome c oxidase subunit 2
MMKKALYIIIPLLVLALMEGVAWMVLKSPKEEGPSVPKVVEQEVRVEPTKPQEGPKQEEPKAVAPVTPNFSSSVPPSGMGEGDGGSFPQPTTEVVNGRTERTIHMGVRQYEWDPKTIRARQGELVRLIVHNADVKHGIAIPELGVNEDILEDGAVVTFTATKKGTFEFFCSVWCGEGHMEMQGTVVID